ncbi:multiple RNA-binding domain-containing protein 1 [Paragonimus westermani]|uniref:Multiple RNA-binding domain-containing protein 1 n=1 Tax=Paragonimus westermani TaxID=34504 RepID=A0A5J4NUV3_9TREM|nr:multiple RNA-binding domain-containing protein 1 [Paragonimus westermani]
MKRINPNCFLTSPKIAPSSLSDIHLAYDIKNQTSKGFAFVTFLFPNEAVTAFEKLDKTDFMGRLLHILPAADPLDSQSATTSNERKKTDQSCDSVVMLKSDFQATRHQELKASATVGHNWNALFIRPDAVATYLAAKYGLTKEQILDPTTRGSSLAVRLAHGETQLVTELHEFLQKHGVDLTAFDATDAQSSTGAVGFLGDSSGRRDRLESKAGVTARQVSGTAFLIKNLPVGTTEVEVRQLLQQHAKQLRNQDDPQARTQRFRPKRVIVPPLGITAIVEFPLPQQARWVYRSLAYEPFQDNILYVQWLPHGALKSEPDDNADTSVAMTDADDLTYSKRGKKRKKEVSDMETNDVKRTRQTREEEFELIASIPEKCDQFPMASLSPYPPPDSTTTSSVDSTSKRSKTRNYQNKKARLKQQQQLGEQCSRLSDKSAVDVTDCAEIHSPATVNPMLTTQEERKHQSSETVNPSAGSAKPVLIVRNVSFQATQKELNELFQPVGGLIKIRLPQKVAGGHRGFAFLEFASVDQAKAAMTSLGTDTHFLGRRLRIEFARG